MGWLFLGLDADPLRGLGLSSALQLIQVPASVLDSKQSKPLATPVVTIGYARCSSEEQAADSHALDYQASRLEEHCGVGNVVREFISAHKVLLRKRPGFMDAVHRLLSFPGGSDTRRVLLVTRIDRLSRRKDDMSFIKELMAKGIEFQSLDSGVVRGGAMGNMTLGFQLLMAEYEADLLSEKIGLKYVDRRKAAQPMNNPPWGYKMVRERKETSVEFRLEPVDGAKELASQVFQAVIDQEGNLNSVLKLVDQPQYKGMARTRCGLVRWLQNRTLLGEVRYSNGDSHQGRHEPLVDEELFNTVNHLINNRKRSGRPPRSSEPTHPLVGVIRCPFCSSSIQFSVRHRKIEGTRPGFEHLVGTVTTTRAASCRRKAWDKEHPSTKVVLGKQSIDDLYDAVIDALIEKRDQIKQQVHPASQTDELTDEEKILIQQIDNLKRVDARLMAGAIQQLQDQLDQIRLKKSGIAMNRGILERELLKMEFSREAFKLLTYEKQNKLFRRFVLQCSPSVGPDSAPLIELAL